MKKYCLLAFLLIFFVSLQAQFLEKKENLQKFEGYFPFYYSEADGEVYLEVPKVRMDTTFLFVHSLRTGLGSNDIGLDRGQLGDQAIVKFTKAGNKLLLVQPNLKYRASSTNDLERKSIEEAFARSVLFGFEIKETQDTHFIIDLTPFLLEDAHGVAQRLKAQNEGTYKLDKSRSVVWMERTKAFPKNSEFEAMLTFVGDPTGRHVRSVAPDAKSLSVIHHYSFIELPDGDYTPRIFDPRSGAFPMTYYDYSTPIWEPIEKKYITRHRLEKKNPELSVSEAKEPIVYYLDPGTPEPVRSALLEGARWWNEAFEAIGYSQAFQVAMLPEDADPMDVRYNVIQWVHRSTRGWSYGGSVIDPRTGEIIKGHVSLGSLRIRQDFMIAQALMDSPFKTNDANNNPMLQLALARIRQLSAHEVGHTLGFAHNFAASPTNRASVMDYPHPSLRLLGDEVSFANAYDTGIGAWDNVTVAYSYGDIPDGTDETQALRKLLEDAQAEGHRYITDADARATGGAHPSAHLWDNGANAADELEAVLALRRRAMETFSEDNIRTAEPYSVLEDVFVPLYFYHRYQTEAAVKSIGGIDYNYAIKGDGQLRWQSLPKKDQEKALAVVLETLQPDVLAIPKEILALFPPRAYGYGRTRESFKSDMGVAFDALGAAGTAAELTLDLLLHPERLNRLVQQQAMDAGQLGVSQVLDRLLNTVYNGSERLEGYPLEVAQTVQFVTLQKIMSVVQSNDVLPQAKALLNQRLNTFSSIVPDTPFGKQLLFEIENFRKHPDKYNYVAPPDIPDGSPIGSYQCSINKN